MTKSREAFPITLVRLESWKLKDLVSALGTDYKAEMTSRIYMESR